MAARQLARAGAVAFLASTLAWGLAKGGHLQGESGNAASTAEQLGFAAEDITVQGLTHHQPADILAAIGVQAGQSLVWFSAAQSKAEIETLNWVQSATVERRLPNQLAISVAERTPLAVWQKGSEYTVIDSAGVAMSGIALDSLKGLPMITGEGANLAVPVLLDALQAAPDIQIRMQAAARIGNRRWNIYLDDGVKILLPESGMKQVLAQLVQADASTQLLSKGIRAIDLRNPGRLVVTKTEQPEQFDGQLLTGSTTRAKP